jgi:hypothetical protein
MRKPNAAARLRAVAFRNQRHQNLVEDADKVLEMHDNYSAECDSRRYRGEDETGIDFPGEPPDWGQHDIS